MTDATIEFTTEAAPEKVTRPHKYDGVLEALKNAPEGQQVAATFPNEETAESFLTAIRTLARNAGHGVRTSERTVNADGSIKIGVVLGERRTRRSPEEVAAEKAEKERLAAEKAAAEKPAPKGKK